MAAGTNGPPILNGAAYIYPSKTLSSLRDDLLCMLGFPDPLTAQDAETATLLELRTRIINQSGLADPLTSPDSETRTLVQLRETVIRRVGHYYVAGSNPQGVDELNDSFINEAQQSVFRMAELDKGGVSFPAIMSADSDPTEIDYVPVLALAIGLAKAHLGQDDAKAYFDELQKYLQDRALRRPPGIEGQIDTFINEAQQEIFRMVELDKAGVAFPAYMSADGDSTEIDYIPVLSMATGMVKSLLEQKDYKDYYARFEKYLKDRTTRRPPNIVDMCSKWLEKAQETLYQTYPILRTDRWWSIPISQGNRIYDIPAISTGPLTDVSFDSGALTITRVAGSWYTDGFVAGQRIKALGATNAGNNNVQWVIDSVTALVMTMEAGSVLVTESAGAAITVNTMNYMNLNFRTVTEVWLQDETRWLPLRSPLPSVLFNIDQQTIPTHFELREFFEIFPEPNKAYTAWIRGHFGLLPFTADTDVTTIDPDGILLKAITWGKFHLRQADALQWKADLDMYIGNLNSGNFAGKRFIPNSNEPRVAEPYPQVTFPRI